ncbi:MAG TPA: Ig-like domain-containing protein [Gemmatimonadaceae bacterium]|nr:Ig-like domain-containing protein [Gemmatimonadaceae bacterium]
MKPVVTLGTFAGAVALAAAIACGSDSVAAPSKTVNPAGGVAGTSHDSSGGSPGGSPGDSSSHGGPAGQRHPWLTITPEAASVQIGTYLELRAVLHDTTGAPIAAHVTWHSSDTRLATVGDSGLVHGIAAGVVAIFASANGFNDSAEVAVVDSVVPPAPQPPPPPADSGAVPDSTPPAPPPPSPPDTTPARDTSASR